MGLRLVAVTTFPVFPVLHGGQRRIADVVSALAQAGHDVTIVALNVAGSGTLLDRVAPRLRQIAVERSAAQQQAAIEVQRQVGGVPCEDIIADETPKLSPRVVDVLRDACAGADAVIAAHPYCISSIEAVWDGPVVYHADDDEVALKDSVLPRTPVGRLLLDATREMEERCVRRAALVYAISERVAEGIVTRYGLPPGAVLVVPPSIDPTSFVSTDVAARRARRGKVSPKPVALFVGSGHAPNIQAVARVVLPVAAALPDVQFVVAGSVGTVLDQRAVPPNVSVAGIVSDAALRQLLALADVALNPVDLGGGVNIKMFDYVAAAAPIITSPVGLGGLEHLSAHLEVTDGDWSGAIRRVLAAPESELAARTAQAQRVAAEHHAPAVAFAQLAHAIDQIGTSRSRARSTKRKKIVVATHHTIQPATSGGARRMQQLFGQLGTRYDVVVCSRFELPQPADEVVIAPNVVERRVPRTSVQHEMFVRSVQQHGGAGGRDEVRFDETAWLNQNYADTLGRSLRNADVAVCTHPYTYAMLRRAWQGPIVYDAMDVEYIAQVAVLRNAPNRAAMLQRVAEIERRCVREADLISTISEADAEMFVTLYGADPERIVVVPPALETGTIPYLDHLVRQQRRETSSLAGRRVALFVGSNWPMNVRAAVRLADVARACSGVVFLVVGSVAAEARPALGERCPENLQFTGVLDDATMRGALAVADLAVNPIEEGSGTCMKVLEYVSAGLPIVTTPEGARGYGFRDGLEADVVSVERFPERILATLSDPTAAQRRAECAYERLSRERAWDVLAAPLFVRLDGLAPAAVFA
jgi:glycosyltransferase involved in cell wall biosynthesis